MTVQEIGALAMMEKLTRIWVPEGTPRGNISARFDGGRAKSLEEQGLKGKRLPGSCFEFAAYLGDHTWFRYYERYERWELISTESPEEVQPNSFFAPLGCLSLDDDWTGIFRADLPAPSDDPILRPETMKKRTQFTAKWLSHFRRGCWLCGGVFECTVAERLEWMRLFPQDAAQVLERELQSGFPFTKHERLELRLSLPREFWPLKWLEEAKGA